MRKPKSFEKLAIRSALARQLHNDVAHACREAEELRDPRLSRAASLRLRLFFCSSSSNGWAGQTQRTDFPFSQSCLFCSNAGNRNAHCFCPVPGAL